MKFKPLSKKVFLFFFFTLFISSANSSVIKKDIMVFKVAKTVFSLVDLQTYFLVVQDFKCIYPDSLILKIFDQEFKKNHQSKLQFRTPFSKEQKAYFKELIEFAKLSIYSESQSVTVNSNLEKALLKNAKNQKCSTESFNKKSKRRAYLDELIRFEVFARSRFLSGGGQTRLAKDETNKAIIAAKSLLKSVGGQVEAQLYWPE